WNLSARGTTQDGAAIMSVLNALTDAIFTAARRQGRHEPVEAYTFDALIAMAAHAAAPDQPAAPANRGAAPVTDPPDGGDQQTDPSGPPAGDSPPPEPGGAVTPVGGDPGIFRNTGRAVCPVPPRRWSNPRYLALLRIDAAALRRGRAEGGELCEIAGIGPIPVTVARDLLGQAIVKLVITRGVDVANITHLGRGPTTAQKIALMWTNPTCAVEGCPRRRIEYDHRTPWSQTRHTRLDELDGLCEYHHDLKTRLGWALVPGKGKRAFVPPDDPRHPRHHTVPAGPAALDNTVSGRRYTRPPTARQRTSRRPRPPTLIPDDP
ncbi:MAG: HNH endonuclease signature motif containing protein, partial [Jiangellaceae bacterium]